MVQIICLCANSTEHPFEVDLANLTVGNLKELVAQKQGQPAIEQQQLKFNDTVMDDDAKALACFNVVEGAKINVLTVSAPEPQPQPQAGAEKTDEAKSAGEPKDQDPVPERKEKAAEDVDAQPLTDEDKALQLARKQYGEQRAMEEGEAKTAAGRGWNLQVHEGMRYFFKKVLLDDGEDNIHVFFSLSAILDFEKEQQGKAALAELAAEDEQDREAKGDVYVAAKQEHRKFCTMPKEACETRLRAQDNAMEAQCPAADKNEADAARLTLEASADAAKAKEYAAHAEYDQAIALKQQSTQKLAVAKQLQETALLQREEAKKNVVVAQQERKDCEKPLTLIGNIQDKVDELDTKRAAAVANEFYDDAKAIAKQIQDYMKLSSDLQSLPMVKCLLARDKHQTESHSKSDSETDDSSNDTPRNAALVAAEEKNAALLAENQNLKVAIADLRERLVARSGGGSGPVETEEYDR